MLGFISIYMATWEFVLVSLSAGLLNGGFGGLFWVFIGTVMCFGSVVASHVLLAMGASMEQATSAIRFSLGKQSTRDEVEETALALVRILARLTRTSRTAPLASYALV